jgi:predicted O-methyltransferase YrrM
MRYELPWITPEAVVRLNDLLSEDMHVLEYGSGGSTLFFSNRCKLVVSFDSDPLWIIKVIEKMWSSPAYKRNVEMYFIKNYEEFLNKFPDQKFNCVFIDSKRKFLNRDVMLTECLTVLAEPTIIVLDNYALRRMYPKTFNLNGQELLDYLQLDGFTEEIYDYDRWGGGGTKILVKGV